MELHFNILQKGQVTSLLISVQHIILMATKPIAMIQFLLSKDSWQETTTQLNGVQLWLQYKMQIYMMNNIGMMVEHGKAGKLVMVIKAGMVVMLNTISGIEICLFGMQMQITP